MPISSLGLFEPVLTNILLANSDDPDQTPRNVMFDMGLHCLPLSPGQKDARLIWVIGLELAIDPLPPGGILYTMIF